MLTFTLTFFKFNSVFNFWLLDDDEMVTPCNHLLVLVVIMVGIFAVLFVLDRC